MRALVRREVDLDKPINLKELRPLDRIIVAIKFKYRETKMYKTKQQRLAEKEYRERAAREESLKDDILGCLYGELVKNNYFKKSGDICKDITLAIDRSYESELYTILKGKDFISFDNDIIKANPDLLLAYDNLPILVKFKKKTLQGDVLL